MDAAVFPDITQCCVCLEDYTTTSLVSKLVCSHGEPISLACSHKHHTLPPEFSSNQAVFHKECIERWLSQEHHNTCPLCKRDVVPPEAASSEATPLLAWWCMMRDAWCWAFLSSPLFSAKSPSRLSFSLSSSWRSISLCRWRKVCNWVTCVTLWPTALWPAALWPTALWPTALWPIRPMNQWPFPQPFVDARKKTRQFIILRTLSLKMLRLCLIPDHND